jgi:serine/threonine protein kinase
VRALRTSPSSSIATANPVVGVIYVHSNGFMHRDRKPSDIVLDPNRQPQFSNFSSGQYEVMWRPIAGTIRTIQYEAPGMVSKAEQTNKVDADSFTLILYEILFVG